MIADLLYTLICLVGVVSLIGLLLTRLFYGRPS